MTQMVQVAMAGDVTEAEELQAILRSAGIDSELEVAVDQHPRETEDAPQKVLVPEASLEAAGVARAAEAQMLALTHLSNRYFGGEVAREARTIFPNAVVPKDFDTIDVRFQERGGPQLVKGGALPQRPEREIVPTTEESPQ